VRISATTAGRHRPAPRSSRRRLAVTLACALAAGALAGGVTWAAFNAQTSNGGNSFTTGTVAITDNDAGAAMFSVAGLRPGSPVSRCVAITYTGSLPSGVRIYAATTAGTGLEAYLQLTVTRGTLSGGAFGDCTTFAADPTDHIGLGPGVVYSGLLSAFPGTQPAGVPDPTSAWATNETHAYRFTVDVADTNAAQGLTTTETFIWDAR
jgi:predicted ribosomally synthesized peptide with SipW-like signal peptide